jgi:hypothetical protein
VRHSCSPVLEVADEKNRFEISPAGATRQNAPSMVQPPAPQHPATARMATRQLVAGAARKRKQFWNFFGRAQTPSQVLQPAREPNGDTGRKIARPSSEKQR